MALTKTAALILACTALAAALFLFCYHTDNKYTLSGPGASDGSLVLTESDFLENGFVYLVTGWELYRGKLLGPEDFENNPPAPDETVFIGQYGGMEGGAGSGNSPHGSATWRLNISLPPETESYTLELPEIYSAYRLYINGAPAAGMGVPERNGYLAKTGNGKATFRASGSIEIIFAVADYSHYYSGMVYPPAFGYTDKVEGMLNLRFGLRSAAIALSLGLGLLYFGIWLLLGRRRGETEALPLLYAALCICFSLFICYTAVKTLWAVGEWWYALESPAYPAILLLVTMIQNRISRAPGFPARLMTALGVFAFAWSLAVPFVLGGSLLLMMAHSAVLTVYTWAAAFYLLLTSAHGAYRNVVHSRVMLAGAVVFGTACIMDRLLPLFEPIRFGWFSEISGGFYVVLIGLVLAMEVAGQFRLRLQLEGRVESVTRMMEVQKAYYPEILEKEEELRAARHDFRHHMSAIRELAGKGDMERIISYARDYSERISFGAQKAYCGHYIIDMLLRMYEGLARMQHTVFEVGASLPDRLPFEDTDICVLLSNLLENALEASLAAPAHERRISVSLACKLNRLAVSVENSFDGTIETSGDRFFSRKQRGREGVGIQSIRAVCGSYGGSADFFVQADKTFRAEVLLPLAGENRRSSKLPAGEIQKDSAPLAGENRRDTTLPAKENQRDSTPPAGENRKDPKI